MIAISLPIHVVAMCISIVLNIIFLISSFHISVSLCMFRVIFIKINLFEKKRHFYPFCYHYQMLSFALLLWFKLYNYYTYIGLFLLEATCNILKKIVHLSWHRRKSKSSCLMHLKVNFLILMLICLQCVIVLYNEKLCENGNEKKTLPYVGYLLSKGYSF